MKTKIYPAGKPREGEFVLQWQSDLMVAPAFWYYENKEEAEAVKVQMLAGDSGIDKYDNTIYTFRHADKAPEPGAQYYKITSYIDYSDIPLHINYYYIKGEELDDFFMGYGETFEVVVDIRPIGKDEVPVMNQGQGGK